MERRGQAPGAPHETRRSSRASTVASAIVAAFIIAIAVLATASAQDPVAPTPSVNEARAPVDTKYTQVAKDGKAMWTQVGGVKFGEADPIAGSPTPATTDFYTVDFRNGTHGFAGGADCVTPGLEGDALADCPDRVPVLYEYADPDGQGGIWSKVDLPGSDKKGFIGAIAFLGADRVLAVGGDGKYPSREEDPTTVEGDDAGLARAWLYSDGEWQELTDLPPEMRGLTALGVSPRPADCGASAIECAYAGGLAQVWKWTNDAFSAASWDVAGKKSNDVPSELMLRVRSLRFFPGNADAPPPYQAAAVTAGCCTADSTQSRPRFLVLKNGRWRLAALTTWLRPSDTGGTVPNGARTESLPDSFFSFAVTGSQGRNVSVVATPGGPEAAVEQNSFVLGRLFLEPQSFDLGIDTAAAIVLGHNGGVQGTDAGREATRAVPNGVRLVSGDGDFTGPVADGLSENENLAITGGTDWSGKPDGYLDWAVGGLTGAVAGDQQGRAAAFSPAFEQDQVTVPDPIDCGGGAVGTSCQPRSADDLQKRLASRGTFFLDSYALNAISMPEATTAWAVGNRGAIERLGGVRATATDKPQDAPKLGARDASPLPDTSAYDPFAPMSTGQPGAVPPLDSMPLVALARPLVTSAGSPDPEDPEAYGPSAGPIVSSRDGSEAWALGAVTQSGPLTLAHYGDGQWRRCRSLPDSRQVPADRACAGMGGLFDAATGQSPTIFAAARIPLENDDDPSNDDDFEAVAVGDLLDYPRGDKRPLLAWYRGGRWTYDAAGAKSFDQGADLMGVAFGAPDDGWATSNTLQPKIYHFNGKRWHMCGTVPPENPALPDCADPAGLLPTGTAGYGLRLTMAGRRMFLYGTRQIQASPTATLDSTTGANLAPIILVRDAGEPCTRNGGLGCWRRDDGGYDPAKTDSSVRGEFDGAAYSGRAQLSVVQNADGSYSGWGVGKFTEGNQTASLLRLVTGPDGTLSWRLWNKADAAAPYLSLPVQAKAIQRDFAIATTAGETQADSRALLTRTDAGNEQPMLEFNPQADGGAGAWQILPTPFRTSGDSVGGTLYEANVSTVAPDGRGGAWIQAGPRRSARELSAAGDSYSPDMLLYHYTSGVRQPVFQDVPHPIREQVTATSSGKDGSFWVATAGATVYRYSRLTGWDSMRVKGWDPGNLVTRQSAARAIAIGPDGRGLLVGERGRIADLTPSQAVLDSVAGGACVDAAAKACGTTQDLRAAAIAPDGSALVGGNGGALLWRPAGNGQDFGPVSVPSTGPKTVFTGIALPSGDRAWLATTSGQVFAGTLSGGAWTWTIENRDTSGDVLNFGRRGRKLGLNAIAVNADGQGYAVGSHGLILQRDGDDGQPWHRVDSGFGEDLDALVLTQDGGAVAGGWGGLIITLDQGRFRVARQSDLFDPLVNGGATYPGRIVGLAVNGGTQDGQTEAWAALQVPNGDPPGSAADNRGPGPTAILHYTSDPGDPLLSTAARAKPGEDSVEKVPGEISFAAFGKSDCQNDNRDYCQEPAQSSIFNDVISQSIVKDLGAAVGKPTGPAFALFTGDVSDAPGQGSNAALRTRAGYTPADDSLVHARWIEQVAAPLAREGLPLFGAIGGQDLAGARSCPLNYGCAGSDKQGVTLPWRKTLAVMPAPWGTGAPYAPTKKGYSFVPAPGTADGGSEARTHYAVDVKRDDKLVARIVVLDSSSRSIATSAAMQNPVEDQNTWLTTALSRPAGVPAIVVTNAPTYSYGPGSATDTATDATALETLLVQNRATVVVSGRIGWNALYWATAPGIHEPCPGGAYPEGPPSAVGTRNCGATTQTQTQQVDEAYRDARGQAVKALADALQPLNQEAPPADTPERIDPNATTGAVFARPLPFVVASGAGGKFAPDAASSSAADGYWHGYTVIRLIPAKNDKGELTGEFNTVVEQRPVLDWIGISSNGHAIAAGRTLQLNGFGREPVGIDQPIRYDDISTAAVTHRYDLLAADPDKPYLPMKGEPELPANIGTIDRQSGEISAGNGQYPRTYAIARLTVDDMVATYPVVFEPRKSFKVKPAPPPIVLASAASVVSHQPPPAIVLSQKPAALPPSTPPPPVPTTGNLNFTLPSMGPPPPMVQSTPVSTTPPPPPAPPPPPGTAAPTALQLSLTAPTLTLAPQSSVIPPPAPPIQPAPPGGARKEARQKQAAAAKNDESSGAEGADGKSEGGDKSAMSRRTIRREEPYAFRAIAHQQQPSAWARDALYGGGILVMALLLAGGWTAAGPRARGRAPDVPAPAWQRTNRR